VGLGMKKGKDASELEAFFLEILKDNNIATEDIYALCTIDIKEDEDAVISLREKYRIPVLSFDRELLNKAQGEFTASEFVKQNVGVDNVCERAASLGAGDSGEIIVKKTARDGMTIAIARRNAVVDGNI
jgi:cobalt-precorrin 5A hydrolase